MGAYISKGRQVLQASPRVVGLFWEANVDWNNPRTGLENPLTKVEAKSRVPHSFRAGRETYGNNSVKWNNKETLNDQR